MKSQIKNLISNFRANKGFTLIELLLAMAIMSLVVTLAGSGFVILLKENQKAEAETQRRTNLNRALDYIANEIRMANNIQAGTDGTGEVIRLTIPGTPPPGDRTFRGVAFIPNAITATYSVADGTGVWQDNNSKSIQRGGVFLVDGIKAPTSAPSCSGTLSPIPPQSSPDEKYGFYACIYTGGNKADLYLYGKLSDDPRDPNYNKRLEVKSTVFTRTN